MATRQVITHDLKEIRDQLIPQLESAYPDRKEFNEAVDDLKKTAREDRASTKETLQKFRNEQRQRTSNIEKRLMSEARSRVSVESHVNAVNGLKASDVVTLALCHKLIESDVYDWYEYYAEPLFGGVASRIRETRSTTATKLSDSKAFIDSLIPGLAFAIPVLLILSLITTFTIVPSYIIGLTTLLSYLIGVLLVWNGKYHGYRRVRDTIDDALVKMLDVIESVDTAAERLVDDFDDVVNDTYIEERLFNHHVFDGDETEVEVLVKMFDFCQTHTKCSIEQLQQQFLKEKPAESSDEAGE